MELISAGEMVGSFVVNKNMKTNLATKIASTVILVQTKVMPNQHQAGEEWNAFWENSWIEMKVYATNKKCESSVFPPQLQADVPNIFPGISMWRVFKSWTLFISIKLKTASAWRGLLFHPTRCVMPKEDEHSDQMVYSRSLRIFGTYLTEVILFPDDIG